MKKTLLCGIQKTGNTWARFVIFNYFNILNNKATKTLTFDELQKPHLLRMTKGIDYDYKYDDGFPNVHHTHNAYDGQAIFKKYKGYTGYFERFDNVIYIYRNPYDTMISYYHFMANRKKGGFPNGMMESLKLDNLDNFVRWYLPKYIHHIKTTLKKCIMTLNYEKLRFDPMGFKAAIMLIMEDPKTFKWDIFKTSVQMSTFENIKKMSDNVKQPYGLGGPDYLGYFCRNGNYGQFHNEMSPESIEYITKEWSKLGIL